MGCYCNRWWTWYRPWLSLASRQERWLQKSRCSLVWLAVPSVLPRQAPCSALSTPRSLFVAHGLLVLLSVFPFLLASWLRHPTVAVLHPNTCFGILLFLAHCLGLYFPRHYGLLSCRRRSTCSHTCLQYRHRP